MRQPKIYTKQLNHWSKREKSFAKGKSDEYRLAVRDLDDSLKNNPVYILSNPTASGISEARFDELHFKLNEAEQKQLPITIQFIRKFSKKFIVEII